MNGRTLTQAIAEHAELETLDERAFEIYLWRFEQLREAGYSDALAHGLADMPDVDLHLACDLLARGCPGPPASSIPASRLRPPRVARLRSRARRVAASHGRAAPRRIPSRRRRPLV